jgi:hypothetical protein
MVDTLIAAGVGGLAAIVGGALVNKFVDNPNMRMASLGGLALVASYFAKDHPAAATAAATGFVAPLVANMLGPTIENVLGQPKQLSGMGGWANQMQGVSADVPGYPAGTMQGVYADDTFNGMAGVADEFDGQSAWDA